MRPARLLKHNLITWAIIVSVPVDPELVTLKEPMET